VLRHHTHAAKAAADDDRERGAATIGRRARGARAASTTDQLRLVTWGLRRRSAM
jgi:hypothetical protein